MLVCGVWVCVRICTQIVGFYSPDHQHQQYIVTTCDATKWEYIHDLALALPLMLCLNCTIEINGTN